MRFIDFKNLEDLSLRNSYCFGLPLMPGTLRNLCLTNGDESRTDWRDIEGNPGTVRLEHLESLEVSSWAYPREWFEHILSTCKGNLRRLIIKGVCHLGNDVMRFLDTETLPTLEVLVLPDFIVTGSALSIDDDFRDHHAEILAQKLPNLQELNLSLTNVTGVGIKALVHKVGKRLTMLEVDNSCELINYDAIAYARAYGIEVVDKGQHGKSLKGRRVRERW